MIGKFKMGDLVATASIADKMSESAEFKKFVVLSLEKHMNGNWGEVCPEDQETNDDALEQGNRILSVYKDAEGDKIWIITEWDRSVTTILYPSEY